MESLVGSPEFPLPDAVTCGLYVTQRGHAPPRGSIRIKTQGQNKQPLCFMTSGSWKKKTLIIDVTVKAQGHSGIRVSN